MYMRRSAQKDGASCTFDNGGAGYSIGSAQSDRYVIVTAYESARTRLAAHFG